MTFKNDTTSRLRIAGMIVEILETQHKREAMLATPQADDMVYSMPGALCVDMHEGKPTSRGALYARPLPAGYVFRNGNGTTAVRVHRRVALLAEMLRAEKCIETLARELQAGKE